MPPLQSHLQATMMTTTISAALQVQPHASPLQRQPQRVTSTISAALPAPLQRQPPRMTGALPQAQRALPRPWRGRHFLSTLFLFLLPGKGKHADVFGFQRLDASVQGCYLLKGVVAPATRPSARSTSSQGLGDCPAFLGLQLLVFGIARALQG